MISTLSTLKLAQIVVLVLMFVRLKQFTRQNNNNTQKKKSPVSIMKPGFLIFIYYHLFQFSQCFLNTTDAILQKPGRLTDEEFAIMRTHTEKGGEIIKETFGHIGDGEYEKMTYEVARYHHEKWNGKGYPQGLAGEDIPLCARIMSVADVFDAVSAKRCYRDAMPLEQCFEIIEKGSGQDFDPDIAEVFLDMRERIGQVVGAI